MKQDGFQNLSVVPFIAHLSTSEGKTVKTFFAIAKHNQIIMQISSDNMIFPVLWDVDPEYLQSLIHRESDQLIPYL